MTKFTCVSVVSGWQTLNKETGEFVGPSFRSINDLWKWQKDNLYGAN